MISLHAALAKRVGEQNLIHRKGVGVTGGSDKIWLPLWRPPAAADVVILALGESRRRQ